MAEPEIALQQVTLTLCVLCLAGRGGECHTPGCALWINRAPDIAIRPITPDGHCGLGVTCAREPVPHQYDDDCEVRPELLEVADDG